ncbi:putative glycolipid-binding domain-containing protein [Chitinophaga filiformis]|uniref:Glycolipid-binding domain-containing protein n=1 Tax=Chitinophaga filiformis TaxID=104663 RepID=A0ABY4HUF7_CHIFI|nr:putative glycolipid-binding domain-containing protein [Chitinophaga filiformis]UPK66804.1 putative glycolipid-binding domain-containing protein [Chitinophaga filiformis]
MTSTQIIWKGTYYNTLEYLHLQSDNAHDVRGYITGLVNDLPLHVSYHITANAAWETTGVLIRAHDHIQKELQFTRENGEWHDKLGTIHEIFSPCADIDISITPFTNTLAVNRLQLAEGESQEITVLYFDLPAMDVKPVKQRYTRLADRLYRYESLWSGFTADLEVDEHGIARDYPGIWVREWPASVQSSAPSSAL